MAGQAGAASERNPNDKNQMSNPAKNSKTSGPSFHESDSTLGFGHCFVIRAHSDTAAVMVEARINRTPHPGPLPLGRGEGEYPPRATRYKHGAPDGAFARNRSKGEREMAAVARCSLVARHSLFVIL